MNWEYLRQTIYHAIVNGFLSITQGRQKINGNDRIRPQSEQKWRPPIRSKYCKQSQISLKLKILEEN